MNWCSYVLQSYTMVTGSNLSWPGSVEGGGLVEGQCVRKHGRKYL